jgi:hypothetical protein
LSRPRVLGAAAQSRIENLLAERDLPGIAVAAVELDRYLHVVQAIDIRQYVQLPLPVIELLVFRKPGIGGRAGAESADGHFRQFSLAQQAGLGFAPHVDRIVAGELNQVAKSPDGKCQDQERNHHLEQAESGSLRSCSVVHAGHHGCSPSNVGSITRTLPVSPRKRTAIGVNPALPK